MQYFREKIKAEAEGRPYTAPAPSKASSGAGAARPPAGGMTRNSRSFGHSGWDDWGDGSHGGGPSGRPVKVPQYLPRFLLQVSSPRMSQIPERGGGEGLQQCRKTK